MWNCLNENDLFDVRWQLAEEPARNDGAYSEELVNHLNDQIRVNDFQVYLSHSKISTHM